MRILVLATFTADCFNKWRSLECLGHAVDVVRYDDRPHDRHGELVDRAAATRPEAVVFIGAIERYHGFPVPSPDILKRLRDVAPLIHLCGDASDEPWWEWLQLYDRLDCFSAQVSIDGSPNTPIAGFRNGMVRLTPVDPGAFDPPPWGERSIQAGMAGGRGHGARAALLDVLAGVPGFLWQDAAAGAPYGQMCGFLSRCKIVVNSPMNGSGRGDHVKGRVIEAGWARACLLERKGSPTARWFRAGVDYLEYDDPDDATRRLAWAREHDADIGRMASRFAGRVAADHHPAIFWRDVFNRAGIQP